MDKNGIPKTISDVRKRNSTNNRDFDLMNWVDDYSDNNILKKDFTINKDHDDLLMNINESLAKQVQEHLDEVAASKEDNSQTDMSLKNRSWKYQKKKRKYRLKVGIISTFISVFILLVLVISPLGQNLIVKALSTYAYGKFDQPNISVVDIQNIDDEVEFNLDKYSEQELVDSLVQWDMSHVSDGVRYEEGVTNILILGEEAIDSSKGRGRTDLMMIVTLNTNTKSIKLTSLMRDLLVRIPGFRDNKLNAAYTIGGVNLLYETVELNFDIKLDGYMLVGFSDFEKIINKLGGVNINLTEAEAEYLRKTNYIAEPSNRNVVAGMNRMNGGQALGYCRIRYVATSDKQTDDYGRTSRQRVLLDAIFNEYKTKNVAELALLMNDILPLVSTDIAKKDFEKLLNAGISMGLPDIKTMRIPISKGFEDGFVRKMSVLIPNIPKNIDALHKFIFE